jgi:hypothetical protein
MVETMDRTELTENDLCEKVVTPIVLGLFAKDEWDSVAVIRDSEDPSRLIARVVVGGDEAAEVLVDYPGNTESLFDTQQRLISEFKEFIESSEFVARRTAEWTADEYNDSRRPQVVTRTPRPNFLAPDECVQRRRRNRGRNLRFDRRRCVSAHRRG